MRSAFQDPHSEHRIKHGFSGREDIDESQSAALLGILDRWESGALKPHEALIETTIAVGADVSFLSSLNIHKQWLPGTYNYSRNLETEIKNMEKRHAAIPEFSKSSAEACLDQIEFIRKRIEGEEKAALELAAKRAADPAWAAQQDAEREQDPMTQMLRSLQAISGKRAPVETWDQKYHREEKEAFAKLVTEIPQGVPDYKKDDGFEGPPAYIEALSGLVEARKKATAERSTRPESEFDLLKINTAIINILINKFEAERDFTDPGAFQDRYKQSKIDEYQKLIDGVTQHFKPEVMTREVAVLENIRALKTLIENGDMTSWQAAMAIFEILYKPEAQIQPENTKEAAAEFKPEEREYMTEEDHYGGPRPDMNGPPFLQLVLKMRQIERDLDIRFPTTGKTLDLMMPDTEAAIKKAMARKLLLDNAFKAWRAAKEKSDAPKSGGGLFSSGGYYYGDFLEEGRPGYPADDSNIKYVSPIQADGKKLCNTMHVEPAGAHLIEIFKRVSNSARDDLYGHDIARITVYKVSLTPKDPADTELLRAKLAEAITLIASIPHRHEMPSDTNGAGEAYKRPGGWRAKNEVLLEDGKLVCTPRFDLDDLWVLYFLLEDVLEPSAQIAHAMDTARYAEERGSILTPDPNGMFCDKHVVESPSGSLAVETDEELLPSAIVGAVQDLATAKTNEAGFMLRMFTLADHTLQGQILDPSRKLLPYDSTAQASSETGETKAIQPYDAAIRERMGALIAMASGSKPGTDLTQAMRELRELIRKNKGDMQREFARRARDSRDAADASRWDKMVAADQRLQDAKGDLKKYLGFGDDFDDEDGSQEEADQEKIKTLAPRPNSIVVGSSDVETHVDATYHGGHYRTRTKGSALVRKELPEALKPFAPDTRPDFRKFILPPAPEPRAPKTPRSAASVPPAAAYSAPADGPGGIQ